MQIVHICLMYAKYCALRLNMNLGKEVSERADKHLSNVANEVFTGSLQMTVDLLLRVNVRLHHSRRALIHDTTQSS